MKEFLAPKSSALALLGVSRYAEFFLERISESNSCFDDVLSAQKSLATPEDVEEMIRLPVPRIRISVKALFFPDPEDY